MPAAVTAPARLFQHVPYLVVLPGLHEVPARVVLAVGEVDPRLFGSFVEHLGRCVYTGVYEPGHPAADADELRKAAEGYAENATATYNKLVERGEEALARLRSQPALEDAANRVESVTDQAVEMTQDALGTVATQTRAVGERAAKLVGVELPKKAEKAAAPVKKAAAKAPAKKAPAKKAPAKKAPAKKVTQK